MCGHVGVAGVPIAAPHIKAFNELLFIDTFRGQHGTGIANVMPNGEVNLLKKPWAAPDFQEHRNYSAMATTAARILIGHNRHATVGEKNVSNTHPFLFDNLVGAHNGTIPWNARDKLKKMANGETYGTDSETLFAALNEVDPGDVGEVVSNIWGAWSLVWWDKRDYTLNFLRNDERPMWWAWTNEHRVLFWASEMWMLEAILERNGLNKKDTNIVYTRPNVQYKVDIPTKASEKITYETREVKEGKEPLSQQYGYGGANHRGRFVPEAVKEVAKTEQNPQTGGPTSVVTSLTKTPKNNSGLLTQQDDTELDESQCIKGYRGELISNEVWNKLGMCNWEGEKCLGKPEFRRVKSGITPIRWIDSGTYLCSACKEDPEVKDLLP